MIDSEKVAHDLAIVWVCHALSGDVRPFTDGKSLVAEYMAAYKDALSKLSSGDNQIVQD